MPRPIRMCDGSVGWTDIESSSSARHFVASGTALLIAGLASAGASTAAGVYGAKQQSKAVTQAANLQAGSAQTQLDFAKEQAKIAQENYDKTAAEDKRRYDEQIAEQKREFEASAGATAALNEKKFAAGAPYRALGGSAVNTMGAILARHFGGNPTAASPASGSGDASATTMGDLLKKPAPPPVTGGPVYNGPTQTPIFTGSTPAPISSSGRMPTQTMGDLFTSPVDLARPGAAPDQPFVYMRDASGRMIAVPRAMVPQGARA